MLSYFCSYIFDERVKCFFVFSSELVSSLSSDSAGNISGSAHTLSVRAWIRCVLQQHLHKNPDGSDSRTGTTNESTVTFFYTVLCE